MSVLNFQVGSRIVEIAAPGAPLNKSEIEALAAYLQVASRFAPDASEASSSKETEKESERGTNEELSFVRAGTK